MNDPLDDHLAAAARRLHDAANQLDVPDVPEPRPRRAPLLVAAAVLIVALAATTATLLGGDNGDKQPVVSGPDETATTATSEATTTTTAMAGPSTSSSTASTSSPTSPTTSSTSTSTSTSTTTAAPTVALENVDWAHTQYPLDCDGFGWRVWSVAYAQPTADLEVALVLVTCDAGAGTPPVELYVFDNADSATTPHLADTLVTAADNWQANEVIADEATVSLPVHGFSSAEVPRCCPDITATLTWVWNGNAYQPTDQGPDHYRP